MFDNLGNIVLVKCPIILIHGEKDDLIRVSHSQILYDNLRTSKKEFVSVPEADHNVWNDEKDVLQPVSEFLAKNFVPVEPTKPISTVPDWLWLKNEEQEEETASLAFSITSSFSSLKIESNKQ